MDLIRRGMEQVAYSSRPGFRNITDWASRMKLLGYSTDPNKTLAEKAPKMSWEQLYQYYVEEVQNPNRPLILAITGASNRFDMEKIEKLGKVIRVSEPDFMKN